MRGKAFHFFLFIFSLGILFIFVGLTLNWISDIPTGRTTVLRIPPVASGTFSNKLVISGGIFTPYAMFVNVLWGGGTVLFFGLIAYQQVSFMAGTFNAKTYAAIATFGKKRPVLARILLVVSIIYLLSSVLACTNYYLAEFYALFDESFYIGY